MRLRTLVPPDDATTHESRRHENFRGQHRDHPRRLAPDFYWQGIREHLVCEDRDQALAMLREQQREEHGVEALELVATEEKVMLGVRSTQLQEVGGVPLGGQIFQVFTLRDGVIVRVDEYERRSEALAAAGAEGRGDWR